MNAADVMRWSAITVAPDATVAQAAQLMLDNRISGMPVIDAKGALVGIVTEGDLLRRAETGTERHRPNWLSFLVGPGRLSTEYAHAHGRMVNEVMTTKVFTVEPATPLATVVGLMERHRIKRLPVMEGGRVVGVVSRANLLPALARLAPAAPSAATGDRELRRQVLDEFDKYPWAMGGGIDATVHDGRVELRGVVTDDRQRQALKIAAENVAGVKAVVDHLVWIEPLSGLPVEEPPDATRPAS